MVLAQAVRERGDGARAKAGNVSIASTVASPFNRSAGAAPSGLSQNCPEVGFDQLASFNFEVTEKMTIGSENMLETSRKISDQIPSFIKELDATPVTVTGYMLPLNLRKGLVTEFLIARNSSMCCYGVAPKMNEWVKVRVAGKGVPALMDHPVCVSGKLRVGEEREDGLLVGIYAMNAERIFRADGGLLTSR